jgi:hypothetical protein
MIVRWPLLVLFLFALVPGLLAADAYNLTGAWDLKVDQSNWGKKEKPVSAHIVINHNEPALQYKGTVVTDQDGRSRSFEFSGAIDETPHSYADGQMVVKRVDGRTITSEYRSNDGRTVETTRTTVDRDGRTMTRRIHLESPIGSATWTEVYERRQ